MKTRRPLIPASVLAVLLALILASSSPGETIRGRYKPASPEPEYLFYPKSHEKVELTLTWLRKSVNLDLFVRCVDEIGMEYIVLMSESDHDRIEHLEFGGWSGGTCRVRIRTVDPGKSTTFLLNIQGSTGGSLTATTENAGPGARD